LVVAARRGAHLVAGTCRIEAEPGTGTIGRAVTLFTRIELVVATDVLVDRDTEDVRPPALEIHETELAVGLGVGRGAHSRAYALVADEVSGGPPAGIVTAVLLALDEEQPRPVPEGATAATRELVTQVDRGRDGNRV